MSEKPPPDASFIVLIVLAVVLLFLSMCFSASESAFLSVNKLRIRFLKQKKDQLINTIPDRKQPCKYCAFFNCNGNLRKLVRKFWSSCSNSRRNRAASYFWRNNPKIIWNELPRIHSFCTVAFHHVL